MLQHMRQYCLPYTQLFKWYNIIVYPICSLQYYSVHNSQYAVQIIFFKKYNLRSVVALESS